MYLFIFNNIYLFIFIFNNIYLSKIQKKKIIKLKFGK